MIGKKIIAIILAALVISVLFCACTSLSNNQGPVVNDSYDSYDSLDDYGYYENSSSPKEQIIGKWNEADSDVYASFSSSGSFYYDGESGRFEVLEGNLLQLSGRFGEQRIYEWSDEAKNDSSYWDIEDDVLYFGQRALIKE